MKRKDNLYLCETHTQTHEQTERERVTEACKQTYNQYYIIIIINMIENTIIYSKEKRKSTDQRFRNLNFCPGVSYE